MTVLSPDDYKKKLNAVIEESLQDHLGVVNPDNQRLLEADNKLSETVDAMYKEPSLASYLKNTNISIGVDALGRLTANLYFNF